MLIFLYGVIDAFVRKEKAADNPWGVGATTLEWTLPSPPPFHQFEALPRMHEPAGRGRAVRAASEKEARPTCRLSITTPSG